MNIRIGYIPYLNMVPFHQGFGPEPLDLAGVTCQFRALSPRALGMEAEAGQVDAGAMSLMDYFRLSDAFEPLGHFGIGLKNAANSVFLFSKRPISQFSGICAVTDETSTSLRLLQVLLEKRYGISGVTYGRIASAMLFDGDSDGLLLIGDEAIRAREQGIKGFPRVTDLGQEWFEWQKSPFVFALWVVRKSLPEAVKTTMAATLEKSLTTFFSSTILGEGFQSFLSSAELRDYWQGFSYRLDPTHHESIAKFKTLTEDLCLTP